MKNTDYFIVQYENVRHDLTNYYQIAAEKTSAIPFFEEGKNISDSRCPNLNDYVFMSDGNLHKNHANLLKAWQIINKYRREFKLHLTISMSLNQSENTDNSSILSSCENGSTAVINYFANSSKAYAKERIEIYSQERTAIIDNFRVTTGYGFKGFSKLSTSLDKGHRIQFRFLVDRVKNVGEALIPITEILNTKKTSFAAVESLLTKSWVSII